MRNLKKMYKGEIYSLTEVSTERYVWHLTWQKNRLDILSKGLLPVHGLLFANNQNDETQSMWHWDLEWYYSPGRHALEHDREMIEKYEISPRLYLDFWRIDTRYAGATWYQDPAFEGYGYIDGKNNVVSIAHKYVCTPMAVPRSAIRLFTFDNREFDKVRVRKLDGVAHCSYSPLPLRMVC